MDDETTRDDPYHLASASYGNQGEDIPHSNSDGDDRRRSTGLPLSSPTPQPFAERKWNRYRQDYNDQYLEVFRQIWESSTGEDLAPNYQPTQLGAVYWGSSEKARLYEALDSKGRHDVKAIAQIVRTKSETEVVAYLNVLRQRETDRQLFETRAENISHIDIPAAIEIGVDCEQVLDKAAAALSAFQDHFDFTAGDRNHGVWLIDQKTASELDQSADKSELSDDLSEDNTEEPQPLGDSTRFFHVATFLELSERFYMNQGSGETWHDLAEDDERPNMTMDTLTEFYDIIVSYIRRLVQSVIFVAKSRIRSTSTISHNTLHTVRQEDVTAALDIMNVKSDLWTYWVRMARRNKLFVMHQNSPKQPKSKVAMSYDKVEAALTERTRARSLSVVSGASEETMQSESSAEELTGGDDEMDPPAYTNDTMGSESASEGVASDEETITDVEDDEDDGDNTDVGGSPTTLIPTSKRKRAQALEAETDEYMEQVDQIARVREESWFLHVLGLEPENTMKEEELEPSHQRPYVMRKTAMETQGWSAAYQSAWEIHGKLPSDTR